MELPSPEPPLWAIRAGLPEPHDDEDIVAYADRLGLDGKALTRGLDQRTALLANVRLASRIGEGAPAAFSAHAKERFLACHSEQQVRDWERMKRWWHI